MVNIDKIKALAKEKGLKLGKLCEDLGEDANYFNKVKLGLRRMDDNRIAYLADKLETTFAYLTNQTDDPGPGDQLSLSVEDLSTEKIEQILEERHRQKSQYWAAVRIANKLSQPRFNYDRFNERRIARHLTRDYIEAQLRLPEDYWEDVRDGYTEADEQMINKLAVLLDTTYNYLMGLTDDPRIPSNDRTGVKIGVFGDVAAGIPIKQIDNFDPEDPDSWEEIDRWTAKSGLYFALKIKGDSMSPRILEGDVVIVRKQPMVDSNQLAVVAINGDTATCKKVIWDENGGMFLVSLNPAYPPKYFSASEINSKPVTILGKVVEFRAKTI